MTKKQEEILFFIELRKEYDNAVKMKKKSFMFHGLTIITQYAKYLLEYHNA